MKQPIHLDHVLFLKDRIEDKNLNTFYTNTSKCKWFKMSGMEYRAALSLSKLKAEDLYAYFNTSLPSNLAVNIVSRADWVRSWLDNYSDGYNLDYTDYIAELSHKGFIYKGV